MTRRNHVLNKNALAIASIVLVAGLTACSPAAEPEQPAPTETETESEAVTPADSEDDAATTGTLSIQESCELFNQTWVDYVAVPEGDHGGYLALALELEKVNPSVAEETYGMFASMKLAAIESSGEEGLTEDTRSEVVQWVLDASGACSAAGVTLQM